MVVVSGEKVFPRFDRNLYDMTRELFVGWDFEDFFALVNKAAIENEKSDYYGWKNYSRFFDGWLGEGMFGMWDIR